VPREDEDTGMAKPEIVVTSATVLVGSGWPDQVRLKTVLPSPFPPTVSKTPLVLEFSATEGTGEEYVKNVFGIVPEVSRKTSS